MDWWRDLKEPLDETALHTLATKCSNLKSLKVTKMDKVSNENRN